MYTLLISQTHKQRPIHFGLTKEMTVLPCILLTQRAHDPAFHQHNVQFRHGLGKNTIMGQTMQLTKSDIGE